MSDLGLSLPATDANVRNATRMASIEARLAALERQRGMFVTPFKFVVPSLSTVAPAPISYSWAGGRLWVLTGGWLNAQSSGGVLVWSLTVDTVVLNNGAVSHASGPEAIPMMIKEVKPTSQPGSIQLSAAFPSNNSFGGEIDGLVIEWPAP